MHNSAYSLPRVQWYGERGIINAIVSHLDSQPPESFLESIKQLLNAIVWGQGERPRWIDNIRGVHVIVEVGLAEFGNPDLMLICQTPSEMTTYCLFLEAKTTTYEDSMMPNKMTPRFNSSINGQLSLKYRFALALSGKRGKICDLVKEDEKVFKQYRIRLGDTNRGPRKLRKTKIVDRIVRRHHLFGLPESHFYYVALTNDRQAFFDDPKVTSPGNLEGNFLPLFLDELGDNYEKTKPRLGWIGFRQMEGALVGLTRNVEYTAARKMMIDDPSTGGDKSPRALTSFPDNIQRLAKEISLQFTGCPSFDVLPMPGSYSVKKLIDGESLTAAKVIPGQHGVYVGIRESVHPQDWYSGDLTEKKVVGQSFLGIEVMEAQSPLLEALITGFKKSSTPK